MTNVEYLRQKSLLRGSGSAVDKGSMDVGYRGFGEES